MKPFLFFLCFGAFVWANTHVTCAQQIGSAALQLPFSQGSWQVGLKDGYSGSPLIGNRNTVYLHAGYYVANRLLIGLGGSYAREVPETGPAGGMYVIDNGLIAVGPMIRYQVLSRRLSPYAELSYQYGKRNTRVEETLSFTPGLSVGLFAGLRIDLCYSFQLIGMNGNFPLDPAGQPQGGVTYVFGAR